MQAERNPQRRSRGGGLVVKADDLVVGDRLELQGASRTPMFFPIVAIEEKPKTRRITVRLGQFTAAQTLTVRRTTLTARGLRLDERHIDE